jgi:hypothetical protein
VKCNQEAIKWLKQNLNLMKILTFFVKFKEQAEFSISKNRLNYSKWPGTQALVLINKKNASTKSMNSSTSSDLILLFKEMYIIDLSSLSAPRT